LPLFALTAAACLATMYAQARGGAVSSLERLTLEARLVNGVASYAGYVGKMAWPAALVPFYPHSRGGLSPAEVGHAALLLAGLSALALVLRRRRYLLVGWLWYLGTLVPVIGLVQVGAQAMADRYTYVPLIGLFLAVVWAVADLTARWPRRVLGLSAVMALVLAACVARTAWQVRLWHNSTWLWEYTVQVTKDNWLAHDNLGVAYLSVGRWDEAAEHFRAALGATEQRDGKAWHNLGLVAMNQGDLDAAVRCYARAGELEPGLALVPDNWGVALARQGHFAEAVACHEKALALDPDSPRALNNLGVALAWAGRWDEALAAFGRAVQLDPGGAAYRANLAWALRRTGDEAAAAAEYAAVCHTDDAWPEATRQAAWVWAVSPEARRRNPYEAVRLAEQACQANGEQGAEFPDTLAAAYAEAGRFEEAVAAAGRALCLAAGHPRRARAIEARRRLYEAGRPFRDGPATP
jgi:tetratricopeptide (TPR) repeat protein